MWYCGTDWFGRLCVVFVRLGMGSVGGSFCIVGGLVLRKACDHHRSDRVSSRLCPGLVDCVCCPIRRVRRAITADIIVGIVGIAILLEGAIARAIVGRGMGVGVVIESVGSWCCLGLRDTDDKGDVNAQRAD